MLLLPSILLKTGISLGLLNSNAKLPAIQESPQNCGQLSENITNHEVFPWLVAIFDDGNFQCSGSLIHPEVVLTAAHCIRKKDVTKLKVHAGAWDLTRADSEEDSLQAFTISKYVVHENFKKASGANDAALVFLSQSVNRNEFVDVACLPEVGRTFDGSVCFENGWDKNLFESYRLTYPMTDEVLVINHGDCEQVLRGVRKQRDYDLDKSFICVMGALVNRRNGGSPLSCRSGSEPADRNRYVLAGIVSWGASGKNAPSMFTNVAGARTWIDQQLAANNLTPIF